MGSLNRTRPYFYRLEGHHPVALGPLNLKNALLYAEVLDSNRQVELDLGEGWHLSTVFLGMDHNHTAAAMELPVKKAPPLIFETALFLNDTVRILDRYSTWELAEEGHKHYLEQLRKYKVEEISTITLKLR